MVGGEGVEVGEAEVAGAVGAVGGAFLALDDGEGGVDVADGVAVGDAVEVEEEGVEFGADAEAAVFVPGEAWEGVSGFVHMAEGLGERGHVAGGVGEFEGGFPDASPRTESAAIDEPLAIP